jgi:hypothetical protein
MSLLEIEKILGSSLPAWARKYFDEVKRPTTNFELVSRLRLIIESTGKFVRS